MGITCGITAHRIPLTHCPPVAWTASIGPLSMLSIDSVAHLPRVPIEWIPIARVPAQAPRPVIGMKITARINSGTARMTLNNCRTGVRTQPGATLWAAKKARGSERMAPMIVPIQAI